MEIYRDNRVKMFQSSNVPITALAAYGTRIKTKEYGELVDFQSGCWAAVLGHSNKEIAEVISENVNILMHTHQFMDTEHPGALVSELTAAANLKDSYKGTFLSSGSEGVSLAVALAEVITKRQRKLSLSISYLGTSSELRIPRNPEYWTDLDVWECLDCVKCCDCRKCGKFSSIDFSQISSFVFEPGNSGGLVLCPPDKLIAFLTEEVRRSGGLVIANEVTTGFGRTGKWFGFQHYGIFDTKSNGPDFISLGKGLGNGYPISGVLVKSNLAKIVEVTGFRYVQSHIDDPLGCIIARKVVETMVKDNLVEHGNTRGEYLRTKLNNIAKGTGAIKEVRGRGMMNIAVLNDAHRARYVFKGLVEKGFFTGYSEVHNYIHLYAPLTITTEEINGLCHSLEHILKSYPTAKID